MYSPRLSKAATTFRSESSSTGRTTCLESDRVSRTGADFMGHTSTLSLEHKQNTATNTNWIYWSEQIKPIRRCPRCSWRILPTADPPKHVRHNVSAHSHVSGVALQFQDGGGEAEPLVTVSGQDVPLRHDVVCGGAHQLVAISTPAAHAQTRNILWFVIKKMTVVSYPAVHIHSSSKTNREVVKGTYSVCKEIFWKPHGTILTHLIWNVFTQTALKTWQLCVWESDHKQITILTCVLGILWAMDCSVTSSERHKRVWKVVTSSKK